jgi:AICAR transformylase/IMP cyclohydrolase PurH
VLWGTMCRLTWAARMDAVVNVSHDEVTHQVQPGQSIHETEIIQACNALASGL